VSRRSLLACTVLVPALLCAQDVEYLISTLAGSGRVAFPAEGTTADLVRFITPAFVAADGSGNVFVSDPYYDRVFKIAQDGAVTTYAGSVTGFAGDNGAPASARFNGVADIAFGPSGELYICDPRNARVRRISPDGATITTFAGSGGLVRSGDGGSATAAGIGNPRSIAVDPQGNVYFSDPYNTVVRRVDTAGIITTVAGTAGQTGFEGDGGPATSALLQNPGGVAVDHQGNLYITDGNRIRRVAQDGRISTVAGNGTLGFSGDNGPSISARVSFPTDLAVNREGDLFIADRSNSRIRRIRNSTITTAAGGGTSTATPNPANLFYLALPTSVAVDPAGQLIVLDDGRRVVVSVDVANNTVRFVAGSTPVIAPGDGDVAVQATLLQPAGVAAGPDGSVYVADTIDNRVRRITPDGRISTYAGNGDLRNTGDGGSAQEAGLGRPRGLATDRNGNLYVAGTWGGYVRKITPNG